MNLSDNLLDVATFLHDWLSLHWLWRRKDDVPFQGMRVVLFVQQLLTMRCLSPVKLMSPIVYLLLQKEEELFSKMWIW